MKGLNGTLLLSDSLVLRDSRRALFSQVYLLLEVFVFCYFASRIPLIENLCGAHLRRCLRAFPVCDELEQEVEEGDYDDTAHHHTEQHAPEHARRHLVSYNGAFINVQHGTHSYCHAGDTEHDDDYDDEQKVPACSLRVIQYIHLVKLNIHLSGVLQCTRIPRLCESFECLPYHLLWRDLKHLFLVQVYPAMALKW